MSEVNFESILEEVTDVLSELGVSKESVSLKADLINDLNVDSLGKIELTMMLEDRFKTHSLKITEESADKIRSIEDLVFYIDNFISKK
ncbi:MAG: phosphopantetheine-binding protein [Candidatus Sericytochromatia bacterium]